jgi:raffinose/stachyose/melibiose transport system substrate-binding protein
VVSSETGEGPKKAIQELSRKFEAKYPNVTVKVSYRDFTSWIKQVKLSLASRNPPDVVAGNQGYQVDGELVKAGLILPLDKYARAYGWEKSFSPQSLQQFKWSQDGRTFGEGTIWGIAQSGQSTGVFTNKAKLEEAGVDPASLRTSPTSTPRSRRSRSRCRRTSRRSCSATRSSTRRCTCGA